MLQAANPLLRLRPGRPQLSDFLLRFDVLLLEQLKSRGRRRNLTIANLNAFAEVANAAGDWFALRLNRRAFMLDAARRNT